MITKQDKIKLKKIFESIEKISEESDMEKETDNLFPLMLELKKIQDKYDKNGQYKEYVTDVSNILKTETARRLLKDIDYNKRLKWREYRDKNLQEQDEKEASCEL